MENDKFRSWWDAFGKIQVINGEETTDVLIDGRLYMRFAKEDEGSKRMAIVQLCESAKGTQEEIAGIFGVTDRSVYNYINAYRENGIKGLAGQSGGPKDAWKITPELRYKILEIIFRSNGLTLVGVVEALENRWNEKVSINSVRKVLIENGLIAGEINRDAIRMAAVEFFKDGDLPLTYNSINVEEDIEFCKSNGYAPSDGEVVSIKYAEVNNNEKNDFNNKDEIAAGKDERKKTAKDREKKISDYSRAQRIYLDLLESNSSGYYLENGLYSAYIGGMLFAPLLVRYGYMSIMRQVIELETEEGYSLEELCLTLFYHDVFGFSSIENFKTVYREEFGILLGKSNSPSIYTLRRFMQKVREQNIGEKLMEEFGKEYLKNGLVKWGVLYIDEHFLPYHGAQMITMGWFTVRNKPLKGGYNFISVDEDYSPFIFFIRPSSEDLVKKIPELIKKAREIGKKSGIVDDKLVVIFDREGYSAELFRKLSDEESESYAQFISWAKYADTWVNDFKEEEFRSRVRIKYKIQDSEKVYYFETERQMSKYGKIRAIVIMSGRKKQRTAIYTNDRERSAEEIINLICTRWGQENLYKALKINHCIDYFPGKGLYDSDELEEQPMVNNREIKTLKQDKAVLVNKLNKLKVKMANKILVLREEKINWEEMKKEEIEMISDIAGTESAITVINGKIDKLPKEIKFDEAHDGRKLYELDYEKKRFLDSIKIFSYHMQKQMCEMLLKYYDNKKEIWPVMRMIINRGGTVRLQEGKLMVRLKRFSDPEIDYAARHLCEDLNQMNPVTLDKFQLPICYKVV